MTYIPRKAILLLHAFYAAALLLLTAPSAEAQQVVRGHVPQAIARLNLPANGRLPAATRLDLSIGLPLSHQQALGDLLAQIYDPASPNYRHYLTPDEFARQFGPNQADYNAVLNFARTNGLTILGTHPDRTLLDVSGSVADLERIFHVTMRTYRHPVEHRNFFAPDIEPSLDLTVPILHISGLDNFIIPHPASLKKTALGRAARATPEFGTSPLDLAYLGNDFRAAYAPGVSLNGSNQIVGLYELDGYYPDDITSYETTAGLPNLTLTNVLVGGSGAAGSANSEVALDIEMAISMAPNLSRVMIFEGPDPATESQILAVLTSMAANNQVKQLSSSWVIGNDPNDDIKYLQFALQGQSFFQASGDDDAYYSGIGEFADDTNITIVGGTTLSSIGPGGPYAAETVWNEYSNGEGAGGSGGGISPSGVLIPSWQTGLNLTASQGSPTLRNSPDVAMTADDIFVVADNGQQEFFVGTSASAPLWAGFTALVNQQAAASGKPSVGFLNPAIYAIGKSPHYQYDFHDITTGNNTNTTVGNKYFAVPGYDLCTGWGTPAGQPLITALATPDSLGVLPGAGFIANGPAGGPFNFSTENFSLTNSEASPLNWVAATPSWLTASPPSGTLPAKGAATVTVSLNSTVNQLLPATYTANVAFTNLTSGIVQDCLFTLELGQTLVQNGGFETGDFSLWTFNGDATDSEGEPLNQVVGAEQTTQFIHSGEFGAAFGQPDRLAYLSQSLPTTPGQNYLLTFWLNNQDGDPPNEFRLNWNTNSSETNTVFDQVDVPTISAFTESFFILPAAATNTVLQFGFENTNYFFGLDDIALQPIPAPSFRSVFNANNQIQFTWNTLASLNYQVQSSTNLTTGNWINLGGTIPATGYTLSSTNSINSGQQRYFRIQWVN